MNVLVLIAVAVALPNVAFAQINCTTSYFGNSAHTSCYDAGAGYAQGAAAIDNMFDSIATQMQQQAFINSYREIHGLPKCSAFPIFHWDGLPGC
jgi:hypothetical protein